MSSKKKYLGEENIYRDCVADFTRIYAAFSVFAIRRFRAFRRERRGDCFHRERLSGGESFWGQNGSSPRNFCNDRAIVRGSYYSHLTSWQGHRKTVYFAHHTHTHLVDRSSMTNEQAAIPRDVRLLHLIFATQNIYSYQDHVPLQLMDFAYRYTTGTLQDATIYSDHAHASGSHISNAGNAGTNAQLTTEDIRLAIAARTNYQFKPVPPKELLLELAAERNKKPLPAVIPTWGIRLPPEKYCLTGKDWVLEDEEEAVSYKKRKT